MAGITRDEWARRSSLSPDDFESNLDPGEVEHALNRRTVDVLENHLRARKQHLLEEDLAENFADDVVLMSGQHTYYGHEGVRRYRQELADQIPSARFSFTGKAAEGETAMIEWQARGDRAMVEDGVESFLIRDGRIVAQTIHYTVRRIE